MTRSTSRFRPTTPEKTSNFSGRVRSIPLLEVSNLVAFQENDPVINDISFQIREGEAVGVIGDKTDARSILARILCGMDLPTYGRILYHGEVLRPYPAGLFFQESRSYNIYATVFSSLKDTLCETEKNLSEAQIRNLIVEALTLSEVSRNDFQQKLVRLGPDVCQQVEIARLLLLNFPLLVCDDLNSPFSGESRARLLTLIEKIRRIRKLTCLFISDDLSLILGTCDHIWVMHEGAILEEGCTRQVLRTPAHPYTRRLFLEENKLAPYKGERTFESPADSVKTGGCTCYSFCPQRCTRCRDSRPRLYECGEQHLAACHLWKNSMREDNIYQETKGIYL